MSEQVFARACVFHLFTCSFPHLLNTYSLCARHSPGPGAGAGAGVTAENKVHPENRAHFLRELQAMSLGLLDLELISCLPAQF